MASAEPYDVNFCFPIRELENDHIKLTPFIPALHTDPWFAGTQNYPEVYNNVTFGPYASAHDFTTRMVDKFVQPDPNIVLFAILDKTHPQEPIAGIIGYMRTSREHLNTEIGLVLTLPAFQRRRIMTQAASLLLSYALNLPSSGGLGLRRVQWQTDLNNVASLRVAERVGFRKEAIQRWGAVFPLGKEGNEGREGEGKGKGRDVFKLSLCWDDWEGGMREVVEGLLRQ